ncbi:hypothetical protein BDZ89DRAFT_1092602 [Hymenopellis radicata]|nr:hypothetical protein BDZ89DRAFT_1092602 [Hymenopellis radicata]
MYHDKRFQLDKNFPFIAFSHQQIRQKKPKFPDISKRLLNLNQNTLQRITEILKSEGSFSPKTQDEKDCFQVLHDIDLVAGKVQGSLTSKKYMRSELFSLMASEGAPSWYITITPADFEHPLLAAARFFNFMIELFIKYILGVDSDHRGAYGDMAWYYGSVEQQGRLTLHVYLLNKFVQIF